jgi:4-cresol dehydrogenase (hydroxylating)
MYEYLRDNKLPLMMDVTGAGPDASIVGSILQRGFGHTPYGDRVEHCARFEVVLPNGELLYTGTGDDPDAQSAHVYRWGVGPSVDGLFVQSDLGIVTAVTLWLMPKPQRVEAFGVELKDDDALCRAVAILKQLKLEGLVSSAVHIANNNRVRQHASSDTPSDGHRDGIAPWSICGGLYGNRLTINVSKKILRRSFRKVGRPRFFNGRLLSLAQTASPVLRRLSAGRDLLKKVSAVQTVYSLLNGEPIGHHLNEFLRQHESTSMEAGLIWISPFVPATQEAIVQTLDVVRTAFAKYSFPPQITITLINPRAVIMVTSITFDKRDADQTKRAADCATELKAKLEQHGIRCYRRAAF